MYGSRASFTGVTRSGVERRLVDVVDCEAPARSHCLDAEFRDPGRRIAVPRTRPDDLTPLEAADPGLALGLVGRPEANTPVRWDRAGVRTGRDLPRNDRVEQRRRAVRADQLASDVVAVLAVRKELHRREDAALRGERRELRVLEVRKRLRGPPGG